MKGQRPLNDLEALDFPCSVDLSVLGIGPDGHLGFNDPPADPTSPTRVMEPDYVGVVAAAAKLGDRDHVPRRALTAGMAPLLAVRQTLLLAAGQTKRTILQRSIQGLIKPDVPASFLQQASIETICTDCGAWPFEQSLFDPRTGKNEKPLTGPERRATMQLS